MGDRQDGFLNHLRANLGVRSLAELKQRPVAPEWWEAVARAYITLSDTTPVPPEKPPNELRPVFTTNAVSDLDEAEITARSLLLAKSVALILPDSINYPQRLLRLATLLEPVIDDGLVVLLPEASFDAHDSYFNAALHQVVSEAADPPADPRNRAMLALRRLEIAGAMDACALFPERLDLAVTSYVQVEEIRNLLDSVRVRKGTGETVEADRIRYLPDLLSLRIPNVSLATQDLVALRKDGIFEGVRDALSEALRRTASLDDSDVVDPASVRLREIREHLETAAADAIIETRRSKILRSAVTGSVAIGIGCATGALGATGGFQNAAAAGGAGSAAGLVLGWLGGRPRSGTRQFRRVVSHLFEERILE